MKQSVKKLTISIFVLTTVVGCAAAPSGDLNQDEPMVIEPKSKTNNRILMIGGILLLGAIIANELEDNTKDVVRDAARP